MRYRQLDASDDMTFGAGGRNFLVNAPEGVAQAIKTRLRLEVGEWFLDLSSGTPYDTQVLGYGTADSRDIAIRDRILGTEGVLEIVEYSSSLNSGRRLSVAALVNTLYGRLNVAINGNNVVVG